MELAGAVVVITGAAGGIGSRIAAAYAARRCKLALTDLASQPLETVAAKLESSAAAVLTVPCEITSLDQVQRMTDRIVAELGRPAILINSAGSLSALGPVWEVDRTAWCRDVTVNLCGTFLVTSCIVGHMVAGGGGYVINLVGAGVRHPHLYTTGYDSSKAGVVRLTEALAAEAGEFGVRAYALSPGTVRTKMTEFILDSAEGRRWRPTFKDIFAKGEDSPATLAAEWCVNLTSGRADGLSGRWFDATSDFDEIVARAGQFVDSDAHVLRLTDP